MECLTAPPTNRMPVLTRPQLTAPAQLTSGNKQLKRKSEPHGHKVCFPYSASQPVLVGSAFQRLGESHL